MNQVTPLNSIDLLQAFLSGRSEHTMAAYRNDLYDFASFLNLPLESAINLFLKASGGEANALVYKYRNDLLSKKLKPSTINRRLASIRSLVKLAQTFGLLSWSVNIPNERNVTYVDTRGPGQDAFDRMFEMTRETPTPKNLRDVAILRLLYDLALRASEVIQLDVEDVDLERRIVSVLGKGFKQKIILTLPERTADALKKWISVHEIKTGPLFINFDRASKGERLTRHGLYQMIKSLGLKVGVKTRPHGIRHLSITQACKLAQGNGMDLEEVLDFSRHKNVTTLLIYRDKERDVQGKIAELVSLKVGGVYEK